ncbi:unnamed protein product [Phytophthora fragariaefolia]|uniref:Unnamed protein product n=1 Tax=Phytophthora fragariaefolia TaxID=1490495 RepID=A0A9W6TXN6_9STRA|nr:unnamed protein product [Phytophthora fragariaefolia]
MVYTIVCHLYAKEGKEVEEKIRSKLVEASTVYVKDAGTLNWHVMQDHKDSRKWTIVERYENKGVRCTESAVNWLLLVGYDINLSLCNAVNLSLCNAEQSLKAHVANPFYATFGSYMAPLLAKKLEIRQFNELGSSRL